MTEMELQIRHSNQIPSYIGISGNDTVDKAAKLGLGLPITKMDVH